MVCLRTGIVGGAGVVLAVEVWVVDQISVGFHVGVQA